MTPGKRAIVIEDMVAVMPEHHCDACHPVGGCDDPTHCKRELAGELLQIIERHTGSL